MGLKSGHSRKRVVISPMPLLASDEKMLSEEARAAINPIRGADVADGAVDVAGAVERVMLGGQIAVDLLVGRVGAEHVRAGGGPIDVVHAHLHRARIAC